MYDTLQPLDPLDPTQLAASLASIGVRLDAVDLDQFAQAFAATRAGLYGIERLDSNETALFGRQFEVVSSRLREVRRPELKWRSFVPVTAEAPPGAETWAYYIWDAVGMAEIVANYSDDVRKVAATAKKQSYGIDTFALGYDWSVLDVERAAVAGANYRNRKADAVRRGFEARFEQLAAAGRPGANTGLVNNANVPVLSAAIVGGSGVWGSPGKSASDALNDLLAMEDAILTTTKGVETPDSLILPLDKFRYVQNTPVFTGAGSHPEETILKVFLARSQYVTGVDWWHPLQKADAAGTGPRALMYRRDPEHVHFELTMAPRELPPQTEGLAIEINSWTRAGGVAFEYPLSAVYLDGL